MIAYKLLRQRKDGSLGPLFINRSQRLPFGDWLLAESHPTKGYALRPGWHCSRTPNAPHLSTKGRVWSQCLIEDFYEFERPAHQGGVWLIAKRIKLISLVEIGDPHVC